MFLITCLVSGRDELVAESAVRSAVNHAAHGHTPAFVALTVACPCGREHTYRTGRAWEVAQGRLAERPSVSA